MEIVVTKQSILVELDALQDTRMGTIARINTAAMKAMGEGYWKRPSDNFHVLTGGMISNEAFSELYKNRCKETLKQSIATGAAHYLGVITRTLQSMKTGPEEIEDISVTLNIHPYVFTEGELASMVEGLQTFLALSTRIEVISKPVQELTPQYLNTHFDAYLLYDFNTWDSHQRTNLIRNPIPEFTIIAPALFLVDKEPTEDECRDEDGNLYDLEWVVQMALYEWVIIEHFPVAMFSMLNPNYDFTKSS